MPFVRNVEIGRVAMINYGEDYGKLVVISDVIDQNRALIDSPDMLRKQYNFKRLSLTDLKIDIPRLAKKKVLKAALDESKAFENFAKSSWGQKLAKQTARKNMTDFDRHTAMVAKVKRSAQVRKEFNKLKKAARK
jgi:large subunit ribosomal protein L14e